MSKLAHSNEATMNQIAFRRAVEDGNQDTLPRWWWVRILGELSIGEFHYDPHARRFQGDWRWSFTQGEEADALAVEVIEPIDEPKPA